MSISTLAYAGLGVADPDAWCTFATDILGLQDGGRGPEGSRHLRLDGRPCRLALHRSPLDDLVYLGFDAQNAEAVSDLQTALRNSDIAVRQLSPSEADARGAAGGIVVSDPDGLSVEVVYGLVDSSEPFQSPRNATFVTGDQGIGHAVISTSDIARSLEFYSLLGFEISDYIETELGPGNVVRLVFLHCNARHHTLALLPLSLPKRLNHLMFEVDSVDTVLDAYNRIRSNGVPIVRHMGRHTNDHMLSFYARTPAGFDVEYGCDPLHIGADWKIKTYNAISLWGHES
jgi:2,3-dihydroxybiphenyl 1,2-dioxygenase